jgi:CheY-like chemotaxis protein
MRILIAEDDFTSRGMLAAVLKKAGHEVAETVNGLEAWQPPTRSTPGLDRAGGPVCSARHLPRSGTDRYRLTRPFGQW